MKSKRGATRPPSNRVASTGASVLCGASSTSVHGGEISNSQRDQIRSTIIINVGGSDSTSESAGDSPSSTSDQEQIAILEELSVSPDSGLGSSGASIEVDAIDLPPTEEGKPVERESSNSIYKRHMYLEAHGFPLWIPQPNLRLSCSYRRRGVSIGDVGIFTAGGGFDFLFNICLPAGHPSNPVELPEGFCRLELKPADVCEFRAHSSHSYIASSSVTKQGATFQCSDSDGALLVMPQGAHDEDLRNISRFRDYTSLHAESWYQYANGPCGREIGNKELHLVTGCDKTTSWGIAAYSHTQSKSVGADVTLLNFKVSNEPRHYLYPTFVWDQQGAADVKAGPEDDELMDLPEVHAVRPLRNQCTFIRSLTPALGDDDWERLQAKVAASAEDRKSARSPESPLASVFGAVSSLPGLIGSFRGYSREGTSKLIDSVSLEQISSAHPATYVVDMLLQKCPKAKVVVVHDSDWCSVIRNSDDDWMSTVQDLPHRIQEAFHIVEEENGTVYLEEKTRPSQHLSTPFGVSVKVEVEDLPNDDNDLKGSSLPPLLPCAMHLSSKAVAEQRGLHPSQAPPLSTAKTHFKLESSFKRSKRTEATYQPPPPSQMRVSRPLPTPSQQQSANMNPSHSSPVTDKTYLHSSQPSLVREKGYNSRLSDTSPMPSRHPSYPPLPKYEAEQNFHDDISELSSRNSPTSLSAALYPQPRQQPRTPSLPAYNYNNTHPDFLHVYQPRPSSGRSEGIGIDEHEQRKSKVPKVYPAGRSVARPKGSKALSVRVPSGAQAASGNASTTSMSPLSDLPVPVPPAQVQANRRMPPMVPQHRLHRGGSVRPSSFYLSVSASTSSVSQNPHGKDKDKDKDSISPTTSTPTPAPFMFRSGRSRANPKAKPKPSTDPSSTRFKGLRLLIDKTKKPDEGKQREQDKQVEGGKMQMMSMSVKSGGLSTSNFSGSGYLVGSTVDLGVGVGGDEAAERVFDIRRATDSDRMGAGNAHEGEHAMETGGKSRVGSYPLNPFDGVLLDHDRRTGELLRRLNTTDSPTFYDYGNSPPRQVLDLGCGQGHWLVEAAIKWSGYGTKVTGYDKVNILSTLAVEHRVKGQIEFIRGNFLTQPLPFNSHTFDLIRMSCLTLCIPTDSWTHVFEEVYRVLAPGGRLELIEDTIIFPPQPSITPPLNFESLFEQMLSKTYGISLHPETFISQMMKDIFGYGELVEVMHLWLAHRHPLTEEDRDEAAASEAERNPTTGLLLLPSTYLPMEAEELEMHTTKHMRTLLSCKHKLVEHAKEDVNDELVQEALYEYESSMHQRFQPIHLDANGQVSNSQDSSDRMDIVRIIRVFGAIKMERVVFTSIT